MLTEECVSCGVDVPLSAAVHMLVNPKEDEDVADGYLCRSCYEEHLEPILPAEAAEFVEEAGEAEEPGDGGDAAGPGDGGDASGPGDGGDASGTGDARADEPGRPDDEGPVEDVDGDDVRPGEV